MSIICSLLQKYYKSCWTPAGFWVPTGWRGSQEVSSPTPCPKKGQLWAQTRLLMACSPQSVKPSWDREGTDSWDSDLLLCLTLHGNTSGKASPQTQPKRAATCTSCLSPWQPVLPHLSCLMWQKQMQYLDVVWQESHRQGQSLPLIHWLCSHSHCPGYLCLLVQQKEITPGL